MNTTQFSHPWKSPLARRLIIAMVLFSATITLLMTAIQLYQDYRRSLTGIDTQFQEIARVHLPALTQSLWVANSKEVKLQLQGIMHEPNIVYAAIDENASHIEAPRRQAKRMLERRFELNYTHRGQSQHIGTLTVRATLDTIYAQLMRDAIQVLLGNLLRTVLVGIFIFALFYRLITRHLTAVAGHLSSADPAMSDAPLSLSRPEHATVDELDILVDSVNRMQAKTRMALDARHESEGRVRLLLNSTSEAIYGIDLEGRCTFANSACLSMLGYTSEQDLVGQRIRDLIQPSDADEFFGETDRCAVLSATVSAQPYHCSDEVHWRSDGTSFPVEYWSRPMFKEGQHVGAVITFIDISERRQSEETLHQLAYYDNLTRLPNRALFNDRLHQALTNAKRRQRVVALMLLDLDRFKIVNDTMGHEAGDKLLQEISSRLETSIRASDTVSRLGGDEFALIFTDIAEAQHVAHLAQKVLRQFVAPVVINGREVFTGASIGVAMYPADSEETESLLKYADSAMYYAKEQGRNNYQFYSHEMTTSMQNRMQLETELRYAVEQREFILHYQPQMDAGNVRPVGVEALLRWRGPEGKLISPADFIPLAEETGLIVPMGKWVLETACRQLRQWQDAGMGDLILAVNVAPRQIRDPEFVATVREVLVKSGIAPHLLELEITESILLEHGNDTLHTLNELKALGVTLAIDDFGTGYSSLSYLKRFPIDRLKIDQSFVRDLATDPDDLAIVRAIIALAQALRLSVIAEGVETEQQHTLLMHEGCPAFQGYYFSRPMEATKIEELMFGEPHSDVPHAQKSRAGGH